MPTYEYECENCGEYTEAFQAMSADPLQQCPSCKHNSLRKLISGGGAVIVRGTKTPCHQVGNRDIKKNKHRVKKNTEIPFWRSRQDGKINQDVLKNPEKYIKTGEI